MSYKTRECCMPDVDVKRHLDRIEAASKHLTSLVMDFKKYVASNTCYEAPVEQDDQKTCGDPSLYEHGSHKTCGHLRTDSVVSDSSLCIIEGGSENEEDSTPTKPPWQKQYNKCVDGRCSPSVNCSMHSEEDFVKVSPVGTRPSPQLKPIHYSNGTEHMMGSWPSEQDGLHTGLHSLHVVRIEACTCSGRPGAFICHDLHPFTILNFQGA